MAHDLSGMKEYVRKELEGIGDWSTMLELYCTVLRFNNITYMAVRRAMFRERAQQTTIFSLIRKAPRAAAERRARKTA